ncbi:hypothetical protein [Rhodococcus sp. W8901]|uniref:hypothetical protein n=1 Tax=Rhodococcus sp. W8901 TaxID=2742603 RepID=UPI001581F0CE|nr:hypothetical protein [Rhodococcus sp. W8901]QKT12158.1 hypothetical protein HUN07_16880 [Rhodococcus sp. W8901]
MTVYCRTGVVAATTVTVIAGCLPDGPVAEPVTFGTAPATAADTFTVGSAVFFADLPDGARVFHIDDGDDARVTRYSDSPWRRSTSFEYPRGSLSAPGTSASIL